jgi:cell shape-determining protein MreC
MKKHIHIRKPFIVAAVAFVAVVSVLSLHTVREGVVQQLGSVVGMYAAVESNEYNTLAQQLREQQEALDLREQQLNEQQAVIEKEIRQNNSSSTWLIGSIGVLLLGLVLLNYYFDWRRAR